MWSFTAQASIDSIPVVDGTTLVFGDRTKMIYAFDTQKALAGGPSPQPKWTLQPTTSTAETQCVALSAHFQRLAGHGALGYQQHRRAKQRRMVCDP